jgi:MtaA/CmuA family methyltransferase
MTGRERVLAVLEERRPDRLPCMPITMMFAADRIGAPYHSYATDYRVLAEAQIRTAGEFGFDHVSAVSDPAREAADLGANVHYYENQPPALAEEESLLADKTAFVRLRPLDCGGKRTLDRIQGVALLRQRAGTSLAVEGWVEGPCAEAADLRGLNRLMLDFHDDPEFVHDLLAFVTGNGLRFAQAQIEAGADLIGIGDAAASLVGPRIYQEFVWPCEKRLVDGIHAAGGRTRLHICGNTRRILSDMARLGCSMVDLDYPVPLQEARRHLGCSQVLAGNLNPIGVLREGTPEEVQRELEACLHQAGKPYIAAAGCEVVRDTPEANVRAIVNYATYAADS